jgi:hypothetical protein
MKAATRWAAGVSWCPRALSRSAKTSGRASETVAILMARPLEVLIAASIAAL